MSFLSTISRFACAGIYISTSSDDEFLVPFIIVLFSMLIAAIIFFMCALRYAKNRQNKDQDKPLQTIQGAKVVEKKDSEGTFAPAKYTLDLPKGGRIVLLAYQPELKKLVVGDVGDVTYRGETMESFQFFDQGGGQA